MKEITTTLSRTRSSKKRTVFPSCEVSSTFGKYSAPHLDAAWLAGAGSSRAGARVAERTAVKRVRAIPVVMGVPRLDAEAARWGSNHRAAPTRRPLGGQGRISSGTARRTVPPFVSRLTVLVESGPGLGLVMRIDQDESDWTLALPRKVPVSVVPMRARTRGDPWVEPVSVPVMRQPRGREYWARFTLSRSPAGGGVMTPPERAVGRATVGT